MSAIARTSGGCNCTTGCDTQKCGCRKRGIKCDQNCSCTQVGCSNLAYCNCQTDCSTKKCSCQKTGVNCLPGKCGCSSKCVNNTHKKIIDNTIIPADVRTQLSKQQNPGLFSDSSSVPNVSLISNTMQTETTKTNILQQTLHITNIYMDPGMNQQNTQNSNNSLIGVPSYKDVGAAFVTYYFQVFSSNRISLQTMFLENSVLSTQGSVIQGKTNILNHFLQLGPIQSTISSQEAEPLDSGVGVSVQGIMKDERGVSINFQKKFQLVNLQNSWFIQKMQFNWTSHTIW